MTTIQTQAADANVAHMQAMFKGDDLDDYATYSGVTDP